MSSKIGLSTTILWDYKELDLPNAIFHATDLGFEAVEIPCEDPFFKGWGANKGETTKKEVKETLSTLDLETSLHAPFHDLNIASLNSGVRKEVLKQHKECIETARYFDSNIVVVHPGFVSSRKYRRRAALQRMVENLKKITKEAEDANVAICLENLAAKRKAMCVEVYEIENVLKSVENLKLTFDLAHANTTKSGPLEFARKLKEHIAHLHLSDNVGNDNHLSIGEGNVEFKKVLAEIFPFDGILTIEGWIPRNVDPFIVHDLSELKRIRRELGAD